MKVHPDVSVVICTHNRAPLLAQTLRSVVQQRTEECRYEILVVDDGSTDQTKDVVTEAKRRSSVEVRYVWQENTGIGNARNRGVAESDAPYIAFIDDDEVADDNWLQELVTTLERSGADCVGGPTIPRPMVSAYIEPVGTVCKLLGLNPTMAPGTRSWSFVKRFQFTLTQSAVPGGGNALVKKKLVEQVGGFRPLTVGEDLDFFRRAQRLDARIVMTREARVYHLIPPERLTPAYLYDRAHKNGSSQAVIDREISTTRPYIISAMRVIHMVAVTIPFLLWHLVLGQQAKRLSRGCSLRFSIAYVRRVLLERPELYTDRR